MTISYTLPDTTAPTISIAAPTANAGYLLGAVVAASYSCADGAGGSGVASCQGPVASGGAIDTSTPGVHTFTVTAVDNAGNTAHQTVGYVVFGAPSARVTGIASGRTYARGQVVRTAFSCAEGAGGPGLLFCQDSNGIPATPGVTATKSATGQLNTSTLGGHTYTVLATSADGFTGQAQVPYIVRGAPSISITSPRSNQTFTSGKQVHVHYRCRDGALGPGLKSCKAKSTGRR